MKNLLICIVLVVAIAATYFLFKNNQTPFIGTDIDLSDKGLTTLSTEIEKYPLITRLDLSNNQLTGALPSQIGKLTRLKYLNASNNKMTGIPAEIGKLTQLEVLDFSNNQITGLPNELQNLTNLKELNLEGNDVSKQDLEKLKEALKNTVIKY